MLRGAALLARPARAAAAAAVHTAARRTAAAPLRAPCALLLPRRVGRSFAAATVAAAGPQLNAKQKKEMRKHAQTLTTTRKLIIVQARPAHV